MINLYDLHIDRSKLTGGDIAHYTVPTVAWDWFKGDLAGLNRHDHLWAKDPRLAYWYAHEILQSRWPEGEAAIATSPKWAYWYAEQFFEDRWPEGEAAIATDPACAFWYVDNFIKDRWPEGEKAILSHPRLGKRYRDMYMR